MQKRLISYALLAASTASSAIISDVREAIARNDLAHADAQVEAYRKQNGTTPEVLEAMSWLGRGALATKDYAQAEAYAQKTYDLSVQLLKSASARSGTSFAHRAWRSDRGAGQCYGRAGRALRRCRLSAKATGRPIAPPPSGRASRRTSICSRLEGKPAPAIEIKEYLGPKPSSLAALKGKPALLFFWAHWCGDCKSEVSVLSKIQQEYAGRVAIIGPTQRYGYVAEGQEAPPDVELKYIDEVRQKYYAARIPGFQTPVSEETFKNYGASTTPTMVLLDANGIVRLYRPGKMSYEELKSHLDKLTAHPS